MLSSSKSEEEICSLSFAFLLIKIAFVLCYCFGAAGFGVVVAGRGRAAAGADGAEGTGAAMPDEVLYAVTTACVTSILGPIHMTLLCWLLTSSKIVKPLSLTYFFNAAETFGAILP